MSKAKKVMTSILAVIICIWAVIVALHIIKINQIKKEYQQFIEEGMETVQQQYELSKVTVRVTGIKQTDLPFVIGNYILDVVIDCKRDEKKFDFDEYYDFVQSVRNIIDGNYILPLSNVKINGTENELYHTTVTVNGDTFIKPDNESYAKGFSVNRYTIIFTFLMGILSVCVVGISHSVDERSLKRKEKFYQQCIKNGIRECHTEGEREKAILIAKQNGIKITSGISDYFYEAKQIIEKNKLEKAETDQKKRLQEQRRQEEILYNQLNQYASYYGREKRIAMLKEERGKVLVKISESQKRIDGINTTFFEKEHDPYLHGGIASGIAGTGAGVTRALEIQQKNADIRERNAKNAVLLSPSIFKLREEISRYKKQEKQILNEISQAELKLVAKETTDVCFRKLSFTNTKTKVLEAGSCAVTVEVEMFEPIVIFDNIQGIIDGTVIAEIYDSNKCIGKANMVFPKYGIKYGDKITLSGMVLFCGEADKNYTVKYCMSDKLWAMER